MSAPDNRIRVLVCRVGRAPVVEHWTPDARGGNLDALQAACGGRVDVMALTGGVDCWFNDEWRVLELPVNRRFEVDEFVVGGDFVLARVDDHGGMASLTDYDVRVYTMLFEDEDIEAAQKMNEIAVRLNAASDR